MRREAISSTASLRPVILTPLGALVILQLPECTYRLWLQLTSNVVSLTMVCMQPQRSTVVIVSFSCYRPGINKDPFSSQIRFPGCDLQTNTKLYAGHGEAPATLVDEAGSNLGEEEGIYVFDNVLLVSFILSNSVLWS